MTAKFEAVAENSSLSAVDFATQHTLQFIESVMELRPNLRFLEVGCGKGHLAKALVDKGHLVIPIDVSEEAVSFARSLGLPAKQADIFGVSDSVFDGILFIQSLHHINPLDRSLAQAARLLDQGGFVLVDDFAFNKIDEKTAAWFQGIQNVLAGSGINSFHDISMGEAFAEELIRALRDVFRKVEVSEGGPYLYRYFVSKTESRMEIRDLIKAVFEWERYQIEKGFIQGVGLRVIGFK